MQTHRSRLIRHDHKIARHKKIKQTNLAILPVLHHHYHPHPFHHPHYHLTIIMTLLVHYPFDAPHCLGFLAEIIFLFFPRWVAITIEIAIERPLPGWHFLIPQATVIKHGKGKTHRPSGEQTKQLRKSWFLVGQLTMSIAIFNSYVTNYQRVIPRIGEPIRGEMVQSFKENYSANLPWKVIVQPQWLAGSMWNYVNLLEGNPLPFSYKTAYILFAPNRLDGSEHSNEWYCCGLPKIEHVSGK